MTKKITIRKGQLGLLAKNGDYYQVLEAGEHRLPWFNTPEVLVVNLDGSAGELFTPLSTRLGITLCPGR